MKKAFDQFGVEQEHHSATNVMLRAGGHMLTYHLALAHNRLDGVRFAVMTD